MKAPHIASLVVLVGLVVAAAFFVREGTPAPEAASIVAPTPALPAFPPVAERTSPEEAPPSSPANLAGQSTDTRRASLPGPRGRVLQAGMDRPVGDLVVRMSAGSKILGEAVTGPDGSFSLPAPDRHRRTVEVVSEAWRVTPRTYRLDEAQSSGATELVFLAERIVAAPLGGRVVGWRTGEPVPEFLVQARGPRGDVQESAVHRDPDQPPVTFQFHGPPRRTENIVSGASGEFASEGGFEAGLLDLVLVGHQRFLKQGGRFSDAERAVEHAHTFDGASPPETWSSRSPSARRIASTWPFRAI